MRDSLAGSVCPFLLRWPFLPGSRQRRSFRYASWRVCIRKGYVPTRPAAAWCRDEDNVLTSDAAPGRDHREVQRWRSDQQGSSTPVSSWAASPAMAAAGTSITGRSYACHRGRHWRPCSTPSSMRWKSEVDRATARRAASPSAGVPNRSARHERANHASHRRPGEPGRVITHQETEPGTGVR